MEYDDIGREFTFYKEGALTEWTLGYPLVLKLLSPIKDKNILDYGCGSGDFTDHLRDLGANTTGVDISTEMIQIAKEKFPSNNFQLIKDDIPFLKLAPQDGFDAVVSNFVLCTIPSKKQITDTFERIYETLKVGGEFVFMNANWEKSNGKRFASFELPFTKNLNSGDPIKPLLGSDHLEVQDYYWTIDDYIDCLTSARFVVEAVIEPTAIEDDPRWVSELESPPFVIIHAKKTGLRNSRRSKADEIRDSQPYTTEVNGIPLHVSKDVFPPDFGSTTQVIVDSIKDMKVSRALDMGTGTGYLAILLASGIANEVWATDSHPPAVECARQNAKDNLKNIHIVQGDLFSGIESDELFDLIVFNHPLYPSRNEIFGMDSTGGRSIITRFLNDAKEHLSQNGKIVMAHHTQSGSLNDPQIIAEELGYETQPLKRIDTPTGEVRTVSISKS